MTTAFRRLLPVLLFAVLPVATAITMFAVGSSDGSLSLDFHNELYPEAEQLLRWDIQMPTPGSDLSYGHNIIWPPVAAMLVAPFTILRPGRPTGRSRSSDSCASWRRSG